MFANYPLWLQVVAWSIFMGLNGYVGGSLPFANLAILSFLGTLGFKHTGWLTAGACFLLAAEILWVLLFLFAAGMAATPSGNSSFLQIGFETGVGYLNLIIGLVVFIILLSRSFSLLPTPVWLTVSGMSVCYFIGIACSVSGWNPILGAIAAVPLAFLCIPDMFPAGTTLGGILLALITAGYGTYAAYELKDHIQKKQIAAVTQQFQTAVGQRDLETIQKLFSQHLHPPKTVIADIVKNKDTELIQFFIASGEDLSDQLTLAAWNEKTDTIQLLLENGVKMDTEIPHGPLYHADSETTRFLLQQEKHWSAKALNSALWWSITDSQLDRAKQLIAAGADVNHPDSGPAMVLARSSQAVQLFLNAGANINAQDEEGKTALMWAATQGKKELVRLLLENGAAVNIQSNNKKTALDYTQNEEIIALLKQYQK